MDLWPLAALLFFSRVADVSLGTLRIISVVRGRTLLSVCLGFAEMSIFIVALSQLVLNVSEHPLLILAYAGGFATGNASGIFLERRLAFGSSIILMISLEKGKTIAARLREMGQRLTTVEGEGRDGPRTMLYVTVARRDQERVIKAAREIDPKLFYVLDHCSETSYASRLQEPFFRWRFFLMRK